MAMTKNQRQTAGLILIPVLLLWRALAVHELLKPLRQKKEEEKTHDSGKELPADPE